MGRVDRKEGGWGGVDGNREAETGNENLEGGNGEGKMGRGATGTGRGWQRRGGLWGRGERGKSWGRAWGEEGARGGEISQMDMMGCLGGHRL